MKRFAGGFGVAVLFWSFGTTAVGAEPTIEDVKKAWHARQEATKSFRIEWAEKQVIKGGSIYPPGRNNTGPHPAEDTELTALRSFAADGDKAACANEGPVYVVKEKLFHSRSHSFYYDGSTSMSLYNGQLTQPGWSYFKIERGDRQAKFDFGSEATNPVRRLYRPLGGGALREFAFEEHKIGDRTRTVRGAVCVEVTLKDPEAGSSFSLWCDPKRDFLPVRVERRVRLEGADSEWEYRKDDQGRWVPSGWQITTLGPRGAVATIIKAEVKKLELDHKFAAGAFTPTPPPGSHVVTWENGASKDEYLVRADGSKRELKASEIKGNLKFDELIKTNTDGTRYVPAKK
ncbi:hypothetical protein VT84_23700 [Gemmata sp. SH-PL17]|uniref:hypothetical protein n=1 Tax=Gemmata sp. SH-PL17 TaxID=1630693 RepID=UPI00078C2E00|nr:hypothetical protein [Gemmata sp. SH-PL17]AMV27425.1 hypothetical protein VT84_23700 [Gemmata sp. SH-PL17]